MKRINSSDDYLLQLMQNNDQLILPDEIEDNYKLSNAIYYSNKLLLLLMQQNSISKNLQIIQQTFSKVQQYVKQLIENYTIPKSINLCAKQQFQQVQIEFKEKYGQEIILYSINQNIDNEEEQIPQNQDSKQWISTLDEIINIPEKESDSNIDNEYKVYSEQNTQFKEIPIRVCQDYQKDLVSKIQEISKKFQYQCIQLE